MQHPEGRQRTLDGVPSFGTEKARDLAPGANGPGLRSGPGKLEIGSVPIDHASGQIDLLQGRAKRCWTARRHVHRPELHPDSSAAEPGDVRVELGKGSTGVGAVQVVVGVQMDRPGQVVVAVHHREVVMDPSCLRGPVGC
jgi:hypothetical protein